MFRELLHYLKIIILFTVRYNSAVWLNQLSWWNIVVFCYCSLQVYSQSPVAMATWQLNGGWADTVPRKVTLARLWSSNMKARRARLALFAPTWRHWHGLDRQRWQRIPSFNYRVVTMDTTYSMLIPFTLHMALCEGHTTSEIQLKVPGMKAATLKSDDGGHDPLLLIRPVMRDPEPWPCHSQFKVWYYYPRSGTRRMNTILSSRCKPQHVSIIHNPKSLCWFLIRYSFCLVDLVGATV